jgi:hypothetical protein
MTTARKLPTPQWPAPGLTPSDNPVGYFQAGAMADLAGPRMWDLPPGYIRRTYRDYPDGALGDRAPDPQGAP